MTNKEMSPEELKKDPKIKSPEELEKERKIREGILYEQPASDSDFDICGPLDCDKQL